MRLPRWLLVSLIAVSAVVLLAVPAGLWIEMPRRTATKFITAIEAEDLDQANELLTDATCDLQPYYQVKFSNHITANLLDVKIVAVRRTFRDILMGEQEMMLQRFPGGRDGRIRFVASWRSVRSITEQFTPILPNPVPYPKSSVSAATSNQ